MCPGFDGNPEIHSPAADSAHVRIGSLVKEQQNRLFIEESGCDLMSIYEYISRCADIPGIEEELTASRDRPLSS